MDRGWENGFTDLRCTVPCCGRPTSLNDLQYEWPAGFARFILSCEGGFPMTPAELSPLADHLGCSLRLARY